jgi:hypothetical protein
MYIDAVVVCNPSSVEEVLSRLRMSLEQFVYGTKTRMIVLFTRQLLTPEMSEIITTLVVNMNFSVSASTMRYTSIELKIPMPHIL